MTTWTRVANEIAAAWSTAYSLLRWHTWENETTDNWEDWG
tara:strand:+ start:179 stop:298 length:120 start_codon:yes stop_codon:yes gene_type:complete